MNCRRARSIILTDYLDGESKNREKAQTEEHLARCPECREVLLSARKAGPELFMNAERANPPEYLWRRIQETLITEKSKRGYFADALDKVAAFFYFARPALVTVSLVVMILAVGTVAGLKMNSMAQIRGQEQIDYLGYLTESPNDAGGEDSAGFGTPVEQYFL